jgi:hypothetical protein
MVFSSMCFKNPLNSFSCQQAQNYEAQNMKVKVLSIISSQLELYHCISPY